jgi:secondary thiamine-phosphate synthase enzyme
MQAVFRLIPLRQCLGQKRAIKISHSNAPALFIVNARTPMRQSVKTLKIETQRQGFYEITPAVRLFVREQAIGTGLLTLFCRHTSASLLIQENADPSVLLDLEAVFARLAPESEGLYSHDSEGADDMPAHIRAALTQTHLSIPIIDGALALGTWQGVFLFEHRRRPHRREIAMHLLGE